TGEDLTTTAKRRSTETSKLLHQLRGDLDWIVMKCLEKDRTRRYETANGLAADLKRHLDNEPIIARPPSTLYRCQKQVRRDKVGFAAAAAVIVALTAGVAVSAWQAAVAIRARNDANAARRQEAAQRLAAQEESRKAQAARSDAEEKTRQRDVNLYFNRIAL